MSGIRAETLLAMTHPIRRFTLERAWVGLTDDELFWEPIIGAWGVRRREECTTPDPWNTEDPEWVADFDNSLAAAADWRTAPEPFTSIGWLYWHVGSTAGRLADLDFLGGTETARSGWTSPYLTPHPAFTTAADAVETMRTGWRRLIDRLRVATDDDLSRLTEVWRYGDEEPPPATGAQITASVLNEISHHGSQICVLRDLYLLGGGRTFAGV